MQVDALALTNDCLCVTGKMHLQPQLDHLYCRHLPCLFDTPAKFWIKTRKEVLLLLINLMTDSCSHTHDHGEDDRAETVNDQTTPIKAFPAPPRIVSLYTSPIVTLEVGGPESPSAEPYPTRFHVHRSLLIKHSTVFRAMLGSTSQPHTERSTDSAQTSWLEAQQDVLSLPEDRASDWAMLLKWMYSGPHPDALEILSVHQPGLGIEEIDTGVKKLVAWRENNGYVRRKPRTDESDDSMSSEDGVSETDSDGDRRASNLMIPLIQREKRYASVINCGSLRASFRRNRRSAEPRPDPPALGPLIRLYILADKYLVSEDSPSTSTLNNTQNTKEDKPACFRPSHIKYQIYLRLQTIYKLIKVVPDREDVDRLWSSITTESSKDVLKTGILGMYAVLSERERQKIMYADTKRWNYEFLRDLFVLASN